MAGAGAETGNQAGNRVALFIGRKDKLQPLLFSSGVSAANLEIQSKFLINKGYDATGFRWKRMRQLQRHAFPANLPAAPMEDEVLQFEPDREIDRIAGDAVLEFLHDRLFWGSIARRVFPPRTEIEDYRHFGEKVRSACVTPSPNRGIQAGKSEEKCEYLSNGLRSFVHSLGSLTGFVVIWITVDQKCRKLH